MTSIVDKFISRYGRLPTEFDPDYLEMLRMSKYRIIEVPDVQPGKCANCGASKNDGRKYVDIGLHIEWYGALILCGLCLQDIANHFGLFDEIKQNMAGLIEDRNTVEELQEQGDKLHETVVKTFKEFEEFYAGLHSASMADTTHPDSDLVSSEPVSESSSDRTEQRTIKPNPSTGRQNIRLLADLIDE